MQVIVPRPVTLLSEQIDGVDADIIRWLIRQAEKPGMTVVEIGTFTGASALTMLPTIQKAGGHLFCVDWFRGNVDAAGALLENSLNVDYAGFDILSVCRSNIRVCGWEDLVSLLVGRSTDIVKLVADKSIDALFIDADHRYSAVKQDIAEWTPKVKSGGLIFGHDFERLLSDCDPVRVADRCEDDVADGCHYGVIRAVTEAFPDVERRGRIWYSRPPR